LVKKIIRIKKEHPNKETKAKNEIKAFEDWVQSKRNYFF
jgi:hypothetical protein